jgi:hypothetical protein
MLVPMKTSWQRHRPHAIANLAFRIAATTGFAAGVLVALARHVPAPTPCDIEHSECLARVLRHEAVVHVLPPVAGLMAGMVLGMWLARGVHRLGLGA